MYSVLVQTSVLKHIKSVLKLVGAVIVYIKIMHRSWLIKRLDFCVSSEKGVLVNGHSVFSHSQNMFCAGVFPSGFSGLGSVLPLSTQVRGFKPCRSRQDFAGRKNPQHTFLQRGSKAVGPMS
jgi:hypothetical protein